MKFSIVISAYGDKHNIYLDTLLKSINRIYSDCEIIIIGKNVKNENEKLMSSLKKKYKLVRSSPGVLKNISWLQGLKLAKTEWVLFLDADTLILKSLNYYFEWCKLNHIDWMLTWRPSLGYWHNNGVQIIRKNKHTIDFYEKLVSRGIDNMKKYKTGQYTFQELVDLPNELISEIVNCEDKNKTFKFNALNVKFGAVSCHYMNNTFSKLPLYNDEYIIHFKSILSTLILKDKKHNRYDDFINYEIFKYSDQSLKNIHSRLELWKTFAEKDISDSTINILEYLKKKKKEDTFLKIIERNIKFFIIKKIRRIKFFFIKDYLLSYK